MARKKSSSSRTLKTSKTKKTSSRKVSVSVPKPKQAKYIKAKTTKAPKISNSNWISGAIKNPGSLKTKAKAAGAVTSSGTIKKSWLNTKSSSSKTNKQKALAKTLSGLRKRG